ncbi:hypothetical protein, conserved in T. vivax [Trypanosoma vivax Y486]|uniref:Uncharacterized protein n=1 Tax=Trypanosoma vivax (strain Y486) TaxID=1055687 RepID=F9WMG9_TRYVY|nr:hypothetical protein, conserved in T. vivax [Trypanosoma vivax Y486]|eukprot:CCD18726.1 hypothetical protein, conserved in T. vivax [Trypanosoma vivax Y486]
MKQGKENTEMQGKGKRATAKNNITTKAQQTTNTNAQTHARPNMRKEKRPHASKRKKDREDAGTTTTTKRRAADAHRTRSNNNGKNTQARTNTPTESQQRARRKYKKGESMAANKKHRTKNARAPTNKNPRAAHHVAGRTHSMKTRKEQQQDKGKKTTKEGKNEKKKRTTCARGCRRVKGKQGTQGQRKAAQRTDTEPRHTGSEGRQGRTENTTNSRGGDPHKGNGKSITWKHQHSATQHTSMQQPQAKRRSPGANAKGKHINTARGDQAPRYTQRNRKLNTKSEKEKRCALGQSCGENNKNTSKRFVRK